MLLLILAVILPAAFILNGTLILVLLEMDGDWVIRILQHIITLKSRLIVL